MAGQNATRGEPREVGYVDRTVGEVGQKPIERYGSAPVATNTEGATWLVELFAVRWSTKGALCCNFTLNHVISFLLQLERCQVGIYSGR